MNQLECEVVEVLSPPEYKYNKWFVKVSYTCYGQLGETSLMFPTEEKALMIKPGITFYS